MKTQPLRCVLLSLLAVCFSAEAQQAPAVQMYLFDNGQINGLDPALFNFTAEEVAETDFVVTSELIVHPNGVLLWEAGAVPDAELPSDGTPFTEGPTIVTRSLQSQLESVGYTYADIDFFAASHLHSDHNGNANALEGSRWIVQKAERDMIFSGQEVRVMVPEYFTALQNADTILLDNEDYDVFGDGSVRIISAPGHTPGRTPTFEFDPATSAISRAKIQQTLQETGAKMWIGHDKTTHASLKFAPEYYE